MAKRHLEIWYQLIERAPEGVLTGCDHMFLETLCRLQATVERGGANAGMYSQLKAFLSEMGLTPAGRSKVSVIKPKGERDESGFASFVRDFPLKER